MHAFRNAGLAVPDAEESGFRHGRLPGPRLEPLLQAIEAHSTPCILALDEVERLRDGGSVTLVNALLELGPSNLHLAVACRDFPDGLEVGTRILEGDTALVTAEQLRFSASETAAFLSDSADPDGTPAPEADAAGWPVALHVLRGHQRGATSTVPAQDFARTWLDARLWRAMPDADRDLVLDAGLLERLEPNLLDDVLEGHGLWRRLVAMPAVDGLLLPAADAGGEVRRMHPLLRECCVERRRRQTPERFRDLHRRIAHALARRGSVVSAMRHASEGDDAELAGAILEEAGGLRLLMRDGFSRLQAAARFLTPEVRERHPRLALAHCLVLNLSGRQDEARQVHARIAALARGPVAEDTDTAQRELYIDDLFVRGASLLLSTPTWDSREIAALRAQMTGALELPSLDPVMRATFEYGLCVMDSMKAAFDDALARADRARRAFGARWSYVPMLLDYQVGTIAMARGQVTDAAAWYARAQRTLHIDIRNDPGPTVIGETLVRELELERNCLTYPRRPVIIPSAFETGCSPFQVYAAASATVVELTLEDQGVEAALAALQEMQDRNHGADLPSMSRYLLVLRAATLADVGRVDEAERTWRLADLPHDDAGCLDLERQTWREMEAIAEARLKLLRARREFDAARAFGRAVAQTIERCGLRRTQMRCIALAMTVEAAAGDRPAATACLAEFVRLFGESDYARPLVRERAVALPLLQHYLDEACDPALAAGARVRSDHLQDVAARPAGARLTDRQHEVLKLLADHRDGEIALTLGITHAGVRYHVRKIFERLNASSRMDAVHRARRVGLLPER